MSPPADLAIAARLATLAVLLPLTLFPANNDGYVGSQACSACHREIFRSYQTTGMGRSMRVAGGKIIPELPSEASVSINSTNRLLKVFRTESGWAQSESDPGVFNEQYPLAFAIGSGANGLSFLVRRQNHLFQAPLSYYTKPAKWDLSPGYESADYGFSRPAQEECLRCHSGRPQPLPNRIGAYADPPFQELAIGCEACHGPGAKHVRAPGTPAGSIVNPAKLSARLAENICMNCHQGGDARVLMPGRRYQDFQPGQWLAETVAIFKLPPPSGQPLTADLLEHDSAMKLSRCFRASDGKLGCVSCHDPHREPSPTQAAGFYREKCMACHTLASCTLPRSSRAATVPPDNCVSCHMPKREVATISHSALTNHRIPKRLGDPLPAAASPSGDLILIDPPEGKSLQLPVETLFQAYGEVSNSHPAFIPRYLSLLEAVRKENPDAPLVQAALGHKALVEGKNEEAITALRRAPDDGNPAVFQDLAQALVNTGHADEAVPVLQRGIEQNPFNPVLRKSLILQCIQLKRYQEARASLVQYVDLFPADSFMRNLLARAPQ